jgi:hypothetical protein
VCCLLLHNRGDGFVTDNDIIRNFRLDDPRPFFRELLTKVYRKRTILSPHFYGMTVTNNTNTGHQLWEKFTQSWGKLQVGVKFMVSLTVSVTHIGTSHSVCPPSTVVRIMGCC